MRQYPALFVVLVLAGPLARAHDSPNTVIHALSHRLEDEGPSARTFTARAFEYRAIGKGHEARADFLAALELQPDYIPALLGAAETDLQDGRLDEAAKMARRGLESARVVEKQAPFHALLAQIHAAGGDDEAALADWRNAIKSPHVEIDWLIGEAECLGRLGRANEQCDALAAAMKRNPSVVLQHAWIRALIGAGRLDDAEREIEAQLAATRWQSSWLLLRARLAELRGNHARRQTDAAAALAELRDRIDPAHPDSQLAAELATAEALLARPSGAPVAPMSTP